MTTDNIYINSTAEGITIFSLKGLIDNGKEEDLQMEFIKCFDRNCFKIVVDFTDYGKIYANVLKVISWASESIINNEGRLVLAGLSPVNYEKADMVGLDELVEMVPDMEFAMSLFHD